MALTVFTPLEIVAEREKIRRPRSDELPRQPRSYACQDGHIHSFLQPRCRGSRQSYILGISGFESNRPLEGSIRPNPIIHERGGRMIGSGILDDLVEVVESWRLKMDS